VRQTFVLSELNGGTVTTIVAYDPVTRVVSLTPLGYLDTNAVYRLEVIAPSSPADGNGLRSVEGATLESSPLSITFFVQDSATSASAPSPFQSVDFCRDIGPIFTNKCGTSSCHGGSLPADGLGLDSPTALARTALGQAAHGANTGPTSAAQPPATRFGLDMPLIDPGAGSPAGGNPGNSWLFYKLLMADPVAVSSTPLAPSCDGGAADPTHVNMQLEVEWQALTSAERAALSSIVSGAPMPPRGAMSADGSGIGTLSTDELERVSRWIAAGAQVPPTCGCSNAAQ
jgi:hypothetical protein